MSRRDEVYVVYAGVQEVSNSVYRVTVQGISELMETEGNKE
jgi:hypothetical protein